MNNAIEDIKNKAVPLLKEAGVMHSSLFGSFVRGEQTETSDIDILVDFPRGKGLYGFIDLSDKLENALGRKVDLITYKSLNPLLKEMILKEQVQIL
jgi:predicted nucleotidyltransferase